MRFKFKSHKDTDETEFAVKLRLIFEETKAFDKKTRSGVKLWGLLVAVGALASILSLIVALAK